MLGWITMLGYVPIFFYFIFYNDYSKLFFWGCIMSEVLVKLSENEEELRGLLDAYFRSPQRTLEFLNVFRKLVINGVLRATPTFNIGAFFFTCFYFAWRKVWRLAIGLFGLWSVYVFAGDVVTSLVSTIAWIFSFLFANYFLIKNFCSTVELAGYGTKPYDAVVRDVSLMNAKSTGALWGFIGAWAVVLLAFVASMETGM
jgi:hypothetical protein